MSVRLSLCPIRLPHTDAVGLLLWAGHGQEIPIDCCTASGQRSAAAPPQHGAQQQTPAVPHCQLT